MSQSLELNKSQIERALRTFIASRSFDTLKNSQSGIRDHNRELVSEITKQASRITDSSSVPDIHQNNQGLKKGKGRRKKESSQVATWKWPTKQTDRKLVLERKHSLPNNLKENQTRLTTILEQRAISQEKRVTVPITATRNKHQNHRNVHAYKNQSNWL